jgi:hypothetical protein
MAIPIRAESGTSIVLRRQQLGRELRETFGIWEPTSGANRPTTDAVRRGQAIPASLPEPIEAEIAAVLAQPLAPGETYQQGHDRRERELRRLFAGLAVMPRYALRRRLERDGNDDALAAAFRRLVIERRLRLIAVLASPRCG